MSGKHYFSECEKKTFFFSKNFCHFEMFAWISSVKVQDIATVVLNLKLFALFH